ncbi:uncharacterized [Tachysurus ichikawai]
MPHIRKANDYDSEQFRRWRVFAVAGRNLLVRVGTRCLYSDLIAVTKRGHAQCAQAAFQHAYLKCRIKSQGRNFVHVMDVFMDLYEQSSNVAKCKS